MARTIKQLETFKAHLSLYLVLKDVGCLDRWLTTDSFKTMLKRFGGYLGKKSDNGRWMSNFRNNPWWMVYKASGRNAYRFRADIMDMYVALAEKHDLTHYILSYSVSGKTFEEIFDMSLEDACHTAGKIKTRSKNKSPKKLHPDSLTTIVMTKKAATKRVNELYKKAAAAAAAPAATESESDATESESDEDDL